MHENKKQPVTREKMGRFQLTTWVRKKTVPGDEAGFRPERDYDVVRVCVQYSTYNKKTREFVRQQIWCDPQELRDLANLLDQHGEGDDDEKQAGDAT